MASIFYNPNVFAWGDAIGKGVESYQGAKDNKLKDLQREKLYRDLERKKAVDTGMMVIQKNQQAGLYAPTRSPAAGAVSVETPPQRSMLDDLKNNALSAGDVDGALKYDQMAKLEQQLSMDKYKRVGDLIKSVADAEESLGLESGSLIKSVVAPMLKSSGDKLLMSVDLSDATATKTSPLETLISGLKNNKGEEQPFDLSFSVKPDGKVTTTVTPKKSDVVSPEREAQQIRIAEASGEARGSAYAKTRPVRMYDTKEKRFLVTNLFDMDIANKNEPGRYVPESSAKYAVQEVKDMVIALREDMPTNDIKVMRQSVPSVLQLIGQAKEALKGTTVGPLSGRWKQAMSTNIGFKDPNFRKLRTTINLVQTRLMKMHVGARGGEYIMKHFEDILNAGKDSPENVLAALEEVESYAREVGMTHAEQRENAGLDNPEGQPKATHRYVPGQGIVEIK